MRNLLTRPLAAAGLALGVLLAAAPAGAEIATGVMSTADSLVQTVQYHGGPGYYGRPRLHGRPHFSGRRFYARPHYAVGPRFYGPGRGYYGRPGYDR